jgi:hypothetical protein
MFPVIGEVAIAKSGFSLFVCITPYPLDRFFLRISYGTARTSGVGPIAAERVVRTRYHPAHRHLQVPVGIGLTDPVVGIDEPLIPVLLVLEREPRDLIPAPDENRLCIRDVGSTAAAEIVELNKVGKALAAPATR